MNYICKHQTFRFKLLFLLFSSIVYLGCHHTIDPMTVSPADNIRIAGVFSDNMVLQRDMPVPIWGTAEPGKRITVKFGDSVVHTVSDSSGRWMVKLPPLQVNSNPSELEVSGRKTITLKNILVGDVWLGSGQSNMWWPVSRCDNAEKEVANSTNPKIRLFSYGRKPSATPLSDRPGTWRICSPETVHGFSGVLYYFGKNIQKDIEVPVGLIHSSVGGTRIEPWISRQGFESDSTYNDLVDQMDLVKVDYQGAYQKYNQNIRQWLKTNIGDYSSTKGEKNGWTKPEFNDSSWETMELPGAWEGKAIHLDGSVWFRKTVKIPKKWIGKELILSLGRIDDYDNTFCNGVKIGETNTNAMSPWAVKRKYIIPANLVQNQNLTIAVHVFDIHGNGGIIGRDNDFYLALGKEKILLKGPWHYKIESSHHVVEFPPVPEPPSKPGSGPTSLFNGMINPIAPFAIRGVVWYQGESNAGQPVAYRNLMKTLIRDWRQIWGGNDFPFLIVQLANFQSHQPQKPLPKPTTMPKPGPGNWAMLREAQLMALEEPNTGVAVAIDIGDRSDIHPANKAELGRRLALIAKNMTYGEDLVFSGPVYDRMETDGDKIILSFKHLGGGLVAKDGPLKWFAIAGKDQKFVWADAKIIGDTVVVSSKQVKNPVAVRYAWHKNPEGCNLYNKAGLPASPFRTDNWKK